MVIDTFLVLLKHVWPATATIHPSKIAEYARNSVSCADSTAATSASQLEVRLRLCEETQQSGTILSCTLLTSASAELSLVAAMLELPASRVPKIRHCY